MRQRRLHHQANIASHKATEQCPFQPLANMDDNHIFDEDPALETIFLEESEKEDQQPTGKSGCLGLLIMAFLPAGILGWGIIGIL